MPVRMAVTKKTKHNECWLSVVAQMVRNLPAMQETWVWFLGWKNHLEKRTATHSSILAWRMPWKEEPGGLQFMVSQRVRHNWMTKNKSKWWQECRGKGMFVQCSWIYKMVGPLWKTVWRALKKEENRTTIWANNFTSGNISKGNENTTPKEICSSMFITSLSITVKVWNNLSVHRWMNG